MHARILKPKYVNVREQDGRPYAHELEKHGKLQPRGGVVVSRPICSRLVKRGDQAIVDPSGLKTAQKKLQHRQNVSVRHRDQDLAVNGNLLDQHTEFTHIFVCTT
eukprot:scaffold46837_cov30-Tisochrysis_lutea.AAC.3